ASFLEQLKQASLTIDDAQEAILDAVPAPRIDDWMKPELTASHAAEPDSISRKIVQLIVDSPILYTNGEWVSPRSAAWASDDDGIELLERMEVPHFSTRFFSHEGLL